MKVETTKREIEYVAIGFLLSMVHWGVCMVYFAALLFFLRQGTIGAIKALLIMTTRGILSSAVSSNLAGPAQMEKWVLIFIFSAYILLNKDRPQKSVVVSNAQLLVIVFMLYNIVTASFASSYPVVSMFKSISYAVPFCAVMLGASLTSPKFDWINYLFWLMTPVMAVSVITIPFGQFKLVNESFQGVLNHPNLFGIVGAMYIVLALYNMMNNPERTHWFIFAMIAATFVMIYLSESRTGMFTALIMLLIYFISIPNTQKTRVLIGIFGIVLIAGILFLMKPSIFADLTSQIEKFIEKRENTEIMDSREQLIANSMAKFHANEWTGSGFGTPFVPGKFDYSFSLDITNETGNLPTALLGDCGIIGNIIFYGYMLYILVHTKSKNWVLFFLPIVVSFGEQAFFATNNIAIYYYLFYGICLSDSKAGDELKIE